MARRICITFLALLFALAVTVHAQIYQGMRLVDASLVADTDTIEPGKPFTVGLLLKMAPGWHTYWQYPGDAGIPTTIKWKLPDGFKAGAIQWPLPMKEEEQGGLETYAYNDEVLLMVEITPPAKLDTKQVSLEAHAQWLVCEKLCVPGKADLSLSLASGSPGKAANAELFKKYRASLPHIHSDNSPFKYEWRSEPGKAVLHVGGIDLLSPSIGHQGEGSMLVSAMGKADYDFLPLPPSGMVIDHPQIKKAPNGAVEITIPITSGDPAQLGGVYVESKNNIRESWFIAPQTSAPPAATSSSPSAAQVVVEMQPASTSNLLRYLLFGFLGGIILNVMPCVLPVITLKIYGFMSQAGQSKKRILELGLAYCAGIFAWFLGLAALIVAFGLNWSFQFQNKGFVIAMLLICVLFGLNLLGAFEVFLPSGVNTKLSELSAKEGLGGAFAHGLFATLMGSACTAPLLGPAIGFALAQPPAIIFAFFGTIAAGMALPYFLLTLNPGWMRFLPKPGMWMVRIKQFMGLLVVLTAVWFGYILYQQVAVKRDAFAPMLKTALKSGRTVFVDFTAEWCINCKVNEKTVLNSAPVREAFKQHDVDLIKADWTNGDPDITQLLKQFGRAGVPAYVIYPAGSPDHPVVLPELLTRQIVIDALNTAAKNPSNH